MATAHPSLRVQGGAPVANRILSVEEVRNYDTSSSEDDEASAPALVPSVQASSGSKRVAADMAPANVPAEAEPHSHAAAVAKLKQIVEAEYPTIDDVLEQAPPRSYNGSGLYAMVVALTVRSVTLSNQPSVKNSCIFIILYYIKSHIKIYSSLPAVRRWRQSSP
jgi:hypothetical protein